MRAAVFNEPYSISVTDRPDPMVAEPTDAVVRVVLACVCGSDLWYYRGGSPFEAGPIGHEFAGVAEGLGTRGGQRKPGGLVKPPVGYSHGNRPHWRRGIPYAA